MIFSTAVTAIAIVALLISPSDRNIADATPENTKMNKNPNMI